MSSSEDLVDLTGDNPAKKVPNVMTGFSLRTIRIILSKLPHSNSESATRPSVSICDAARSRASKQRGYCIRSSEAIAGFTIV
jgi:hypothetical protein